MGLFMAKLLVVWLWRYWLVSGRPFWNLSRICSGCGGILVQETTTLVLAGLGLGFLSSSYHPVLCFSLQYQIQYIELRGAAAAAAYDQNIGKGLWFFCLFLYLLCLSVSRRRKKKKMGVFTFVCRRSSGDDEWSGKQLSGGDLEASATSTFELQRRLVQAALSSDSSGGVQSSFSMITPSSAVFQVPSFLPHHHFISFHSHGKSESELGFVSVWASS